MVLPSLSILVTSSKPLPTYKMVSRLPLLTVICLILCLSTPYSNCAFRILFYSNPFYYGLRWLWGKHKIFGGNYRKVVRTGAGKTYSYMPRPFFRYPRLLRGLIRCFCRVQFSCACGKFRKIIAQISWSCHLYLIPKALQPPT